MNYKELTINKYLLAVQEKKSVPGGGSALALVLSTAISLNMMVIEFTIGKKGYEEYQEELILLKKALTNYYLKAYELIDLDAEAYLEVMRTYKTGGEEFKKASLNACHIPLRLYKLGKKCEEISTRLIEIGNKNLVNDAKVSKNLCLSIYEGCIDNIHSNYGSLTEEEKNYFNNELK